MEGKTSGIDDYKIIRVIPVYPMPQAGQHSGILPAGMVSVLEFCIAAFLPSLIFAFSQDIIVPAVTATSMALSKDFESFMYLNYG